MRNQLQGVRSTKAPLPGTKLSPAEKKLNVFINVYEPKGTMYMDQMGKFPHCSSGGKKYQIILHEIDGNSTYIEPMKNKI